MSSRPETAALPESFDPLSAEFAKNPYPAYAALRKSRALPFFPDYQMWLVSRYPDVAALVTDDRLVRTLDSIMSAEEIEAQRRKDNWHDMPYHSRFVQFSLLDSDGEVHDRLRRQVFSFFGPAPIRRLKDSIQTHVDSVLDALADRDEYDFVEDLAAQLPGHVIGTLIGVPAEDCSMLRIWSERVVQFFDIDRTDEKKKIAEDTTREFYEYLRELKRQRKASPGDDLISKLIAVENAGNINEDEFYSTCMLIVMAGHGSTLDVLGSGMHALLRFPEQMQRLRNDPSLMKTAIQEMFRYESPLPFFHRYAAEDVRVGDRSFPRGTRFGLLYSSANRDSDAFDNPDIFDVGRTPNRHLAFGGGAHFCLGNHLARSNMEVLFRKLLTRTSTIELAQDAPEYKTGLSTRGPKTLHIAVTQGK